MKKDKSNSIYCFQMVKQRKKGFLCLVIAANLFNLGLGFFTARMTSRIVDLFALKSGNAIWVSVAYISSFILWDILSNRINAELEVLRFQIKGSLRKDLYLREMALRYQTIESPEIQNLSNMVSQNIDNENSVITLTELIIQLATQIASALIFGSFLVDLSWLCILVIIVFTVVMLILGLVGVKIDDDVRKEKADLSRKEKYCSGKAAGFDFSKDVRLFGLEKLILPELKTVQALSYALEKKTASKREWIQIMVLIGALAEQCILYYIFFKQMKEGLLSPGSFVWYTAAISNFEEAVLAIFSGGMVEIAETGKKVSYFREYMNLEQGENEKETVSLLEDYLPEIIEFKDVSYRFPGAVNDTVQNVSLKIHRGEKIAIVGLNGAGKSTLVKLLCGLYLPTSGDILIDGCPATNIKRDDYYRLYAPVFQEIETLPLTIREIITCDFSPDRDAERDARLNEIIELVGLKEKISSLSDGADTRLAKGIFDDSVDLSGGEKQKLLIARALYKDAGFVILDEPTSALDPLAEKQLYDSYHDMFRDKTVLYISHRLASTFFCDRIILLENGQIAEIGSFDELMKQNGKYAALFRKQQELYTQEERAGK